MKGHRILLIIIIETLLPSCGNFSDTIKGKIDDAKNQANIQLANNYNQELNSLNEAYQNALKSADDTLMKKIKLGYTSIISTTTYIDSLRNVLLKLDSQDPKSHEFVETIFINNGVADTVFKKLKSSFGLALQIAHTGSIKADINKRCENFVPNGLNESANNFTSKKFLFFKLHSPEMEIWTLYGMESELVNCGILALTDCTNYISLN